MKFHQFILEKQKNKKVIYEEIGSQIQNKMINWLGS